MGGRASLEEGDMGSDLLSVVDGKLQRLRNSNKVLFVDTTWTWVSQVLRTFKDNDIECILCIGGLCV